MAMELRRPPSEIFFSPGLEPGISYIEEPDWIIRPAAGAKVDLIAASDIPAIQAEMVEANDRYAARLLDDVIEIRVSPVVLENATYHNSYALIGGRYLLNGATGDRLRTKFDTRNDVAWRRERLISFFRRRRHAERLDPDLAPPSRKRPVALELKNGSNFYHFLTETLGNLAFFVNDDSDQPIALHHGGADIRGFIPAFIKAVYPELAHRIEFVSNRRKYKKVRSTYNHRHYLYQVMDPRVSDVLTSDAVDPRWDRFRPDVRSYKSVRMNSFDSSLRLLRDTAISRLSPDLVAGLPKRIYVDRAEGKGARTRGVEGDGPLLEALAARGFERVFFEKMTPLMQIASMQAADIMISPHGAGLANMVFARPDTLAVEIGTRQTQLHRWGDFLSVAHTSGCRYATVFADVNSDDPEQVPSIKDGHIGIRLGQRAVDEILTLVDGYAPASSPRNS